MPTYFIRTNEIKQICCFAISYCDSQIRIHFWEIKTNRKFREINSGFADSGLGVRSYEQDHVYWFCYCFFFRQNSLIG